MQRLADNCRPFSVLTLSLLRELPLPYGTVAQAVVWLPDEAIVEESQEVVDGRRRRVTIAAMSG